LLRAIAQQPSFTDALMARGCGVVYFALLPAGNDADSLRRLTELVSSIFQLCAKENTSAALPWCPTVLKRAIDIWGPPRSDLALMRPSNPPSTRKTSSPRPLSGNLTSSLRHLII
jgi:hypothetical protein